MFKELAHFLEIFNKNYFLITTALGLAKHQGLYKLGSEFGLLSSHSKLLKALNSLGFKAFLISVVDGLVDGLEKNSKINAFGPIF